jgi:2-iminobutanoate/2-iminopropanoate deaminase
MREGMAKPMRKASFLILGGLILTGAAAALSGAASAPQHAPKKQVIKPAGAPAMGLPFSPGILMGDTLYLSGVIGADATGQPVAGGFEPEMRQAFTNAQGVLKAANMDFPDVVSVVVYLADIKDFPQMNTIYKEYFKSEPLPTRSTVSVKDLVRNAKIEVTMTAVRTNQ